MTLAEIMRNAGGPTDATFQQPVDANAFGPTGVVSSASGSGAELTPQAGFLRGLAAYLRKSGHRADPLVHEGGIPGAETLIQGTGSRKNLMGSVVKVGSSIFHVYFHPNGRREVVKVAGPGIHGTGIVHAASGSGLPQGSTGGLLAP